jgi:peptidyl-tRNA hydrolase
MNQETGWTKGKMMSQAAHASIKVFFDKMTQLGDSTWDCRFTKDMIEWKNESFTKIVLKVFTQEHVETGYNLAKDLEIPCALVKDNGNTQATEGGITCAIGPFNVTNEKYKQLVTWLNIWKLY